MSDLNHAQSFRELIVYQKARAVAKDVFEMTKAFPQEERFSLTDQIRRSSRSVGAQIAEAWAKRRYEKHFVSKLTDADGEQQETQHWIESAQDCDYITELETARLLEAMSGIGRMLNSMMRKASMFCESKDNVVREGAVEYFSTEVPLTTDN